jgi:hypothetical protein
MHQEIIIIIPYMSTLPLPILFTFLLSRKQLVFVNVGYTLHMKSMYFVWMRFINLSLDNTVHSIHLCNKRRLVFVSRYLHIWPMVYWLITCGYMYGTLIIDHWSLINLLANCTAKRIIERLGWYPDPGTRTKAVQVQFKLFKTIDRI